MHNEGTVIFFRIFFLYIHFFILCNRSYSDYSHSYKSSLIAEFIHPDFLSSQHSVSFLIMSYCFCITNISLIVEHNIYLVQLLSSFSCPNLDYKNPKARIMVENLTDLQNNLENCFFIYIKFTFVNRLGVI